MGEKSKNIGEKGERIVRDFLNLIGWTPFKNNIEIDCFYKKKHEKTTHGIDFLYSYHCPLHSKTVENVSISVKYSEDPYPIAESTNHKGLKSVFKSHFTDLATTIECFKKSQQRRDTNKSFVGVQKSKESGILFWLNDNSANINTGIIDYLSSARVDSALVYDAIHIIDNKRINEIRDALNFVKQENNDAVITYDYLNTGSNVDEGRQINGTILPLQYLSSQILPIRIEKKDGQKILQIVSFENFDIDSLRRIIGLTQNYVLSYQMKTIVSFPDYNPTQESKNEIANVKSAFPTLSPENIIVNSFRPNHRNYDS